MRPVFLLLTLASALFAWHVLSRSHEDSIAEQTERLRAQKELLERQTFALGSVDPLTGKTRIVELIERATEIEGARWDEGQIDAMARICWRESHYNPLLENPESSAFGLYQFLDSTWLGTGIKKTSDPLLQTIAAVRYIEARYGTPKAALAFHREEHLINGELVHYF